MPTRIRLQRKGKKGRPYYHVVVADSRAPRDGKYIERIGAYDPNQNPAFVEVNTDKALDWLQKGAQPSDTCRAILSYSGVVYKNHLANGVKKGAFDQEEADRRFDIWKNEKNTKIEGKKTKLAAGAEADLKTRLEAENKVAADMASAQSAKRAALAAPPEIIPMETPTEGAPEAVAEEAAPEVVAEVPEVAAETEAAKEEAPEARKAEGEAPAAE